MTIELFCSKCNATSEAFTIKNGNLISSQCALYEQEQEGKKSEMSKGDYFLDMAINAAIEYVQKKEGIELEEKIDKDTSLL
jgi:hypothetical protein